MMSLVRCPMYRSDFAVSAAGRFGGHTEMTKPTLSPSVAPDFYWIRESLRRRIRCRSRSTQNRPHPCAAFPTLRYLPVATDPTTDIFREARKPPLYCRAALRLPRLCLQCVE